MRAIITNCNFLNSFERILSHQLTGWLSFLFIFFFSLSPSNASPINSDSIHSVVDRIPSFQGRPSNFERFIRRNLVYPDEAWSHGIEGVVKVSFVITSDGTLVNAQIEESVDPLLDMEALRIVDLLSEWRPGRRDGEVVNTRMSIPVVFSLSEEEREFVSTLKRFELHENPPLYVIDGKMVKSRIHLPSYNVESVRVIKGEAAIERFGEAASNGVVIITTKRGTKPVR